MSDLSLHACGGTLLAGPDHSYCDRCAAFAYDGAPVPPGTDRTANRAAWDAGDEASPEGGLVVVCTHDAYCPTEQRFSSVEAFLDMCRDSFGKAPTLTARVGRLGYEFLDETGAVVLREVI